jgi:hypothetical protein
MSVRAVIRLCRFGVPVELRGGPAAYLDWPVPPAVSPLLHLTDGHGTGPAFAAMTRTWVDHGKREVLAEFEAVEVREAEAKLLGLNTRTGLSLEWSATSEELAPDRTPDGRSALVQRGVTINAVSVVGRPARSDTVLLSVTGTPNAERASFADLPPQIRDRYAGVVRGPATGRIVSAV